MNGGIVRLVVFDLKSSGYQPLIYAQPSDFRICKPKDCSEWPKTRGYFNKIRTCPEQSKRPGPVISIPPVTLAISRPSDLAMFIRLRHSYLRYFTASDFHPRNRRRQTG